MTNVRSIVMLQQREYNSIRDNTKEMEKKREDVNQCGKPPALVPGSESQSQTTRTAKQCFFLYNHHPHHVTTVIRYNFISKLRADKMVIDNITNDGVFVILSRFTLYHHTNVQTCPAV